MRLQRVTCRLNGSGVVTQQDKHNPATITDDRWKEIDIMNPSIFYFALLCAHGRRAAMLDSIPAGTLGPRVGLHPGQVASSLQGTRTYGQLSVPSFASRVCFWTAVGRRRAWRESTSIHGNPALDSDPESQHVMVLQAGRRQYSAHSLTMQV